MKNLPVIIVSLSLFVLFGISIVVNNMTFIIVVALMNFAWGLLGLIYAIKNTIQDRKKSTPDDYKMD